MAGSKRDAGGRHRATPDPRAERVGARIRQLRRQLEFSFDAFVEETGLGRGYVSELERGLVVPSLSVLARIADALETTVADLVLGDTPREQLFAMTRTLPPIELFRLITSVHKVRPRDEPGHFPFRRLAPGHGNARTAVPLYAIRPGAHHFSDYQEGGITAWVEPPEGVKPKRGLCIMRVAGRSLEPAVHDGAWCLFDRPWRQPRAHELGIFVKAGLSPDTGGYFCIRPYPASRGRPEEAEPGRPCARFVRVLG
jgi:transcriptional regulator with XRE-family HTH domain